MQATTIIYSDRCLEYRDPGHPESPERVQAAAAYLKKQGYEFTQPLPASQDDLLLAHSRDLVERIRSGRFFESDTPNLPGIYDLALLSAGAAILAADTALSGHPAFSLMRPPGHHAGKNKLGGFCYCNNIAVAAARFLKAGRRVAIIDIDVHHGNGTQDIFLNQDGVIYLSLHRGWIYPNTGYESEGNCYNYALEESVGPDEYLELFERGLENVKAFEPDVIAVSAGFDTFAGDKLIGMGFGLGHYGKIGELIGEFRKPVFAVLEGGYHDRIGECVEALMGGVAGRND